MCRTISIAVAIIGASRDGTIHADGRSCPKYSRDGCRFTGTRRDVADHSVYCLRMHQQLVEQEAALARVERSLKRTRDAWDTEVRSVRRKLETLRDEHDQTLEALDDVVDDHQSLQDAHDQLAADFEREQRARMRAEFEADQLAMENAELQWTTESLERQVTDLLDDGRGGLVAPWRLIPADPYPDFAPMPDPTPSTDMDSGSDVESIRHTSGYGTPVSAYLEDDERSLPSSASSPPDWMTKYIGQDFSDEYPTPSSCGSSRCVRVNADWADDSQRSRCLGRLGWPAVAARRIAASLSGLRSQHVVLRRPRAGRRRRPLYLRFAPDT